MLTVFVTLCGRIILESCFVLEMSTDYEIEGTDSFFTAKSLVSLGLVPLGELSSCITDLCRIVLGERASILDCRFIASSNISSR